MRLYVNPLTDMVATAMIFWAFAFLTNMRVRNAWEAHQAFNFFGSIFIIVVTFDVLLSLLIAMARAIN
jgi:hypothetical protein